MSLLGTQVYANPTSPCWVSTAGGSISGALTVDGTLNVTGASTLANTLFTTTAGAVVGLGAGVNVGLELRSDGVDGNINSDGVIYFGREGTVGGSTSITPGATPNTDVVVIGGRLTTAPGGGITPEVSLVPAPVLLTIGGGQVALVPNPVLPIFNNNWYDIQVTGYWGIPIGSVPAVGDILSLRFSVGAAGLPTFFQESSQLFQYPGFADDTWTAGSLHGFQLRGRLFSGNNFANLPIAAELTGPGVYPSGVDCVVQAISVVRLS